MQEKNSEKVRAVLLRLASEAKVKKIKGLAGFIEMPVTTLYGWIRNGNIGDTTSILTKFPRVREEWLKTNEGPMLKYEPPVGNDIRCRHGQSSMELSPKIAARIEPGNFIGNHHQKAITPKGSIDRDKEEDALSDDEIDNMVQMTKRVLQSDTIHRSALASNIRAFHYAVEKEEEVKTTNEKIESLMVEMAADRAEMKEMKDLLRQLVGEKPKREAAN